MYPLLHSFKYSLFKKLTFVPVACVLTGAHRDCLIVASFDQKPEIQCLVSQGQIVYIKLS